MKNELRTVKISDIKPYWRNPRVGNVDNVKQSIKDYGYNQYIVVDQELVIIVGHTRYKALQELALESDEWKEVMVLVLSLDPRKAKEYRIVDNQTGDQSEWIIDKLSQELRELDQGVQMKYFSNAELDRLVKSQAGAVNYQPIDAGDVAKRGQELNKQMLQGDDNRKHIARKVLCPNCGEEFEVS